MPSDLKPPVFLERRSYRQRRMMDAVRLLPLIGLLLWLLPTLWSVSDDGGVEPVNMSQAIVYVFGVWVCLIISGGVLWRYLVAGGATPSSLDPDTTLVSE
jgi:hypothetical protein